MKPREEEGRKRREARRRRGRRERRCAGQDRGEEEMERGDGGRRRRREEGEGGGGGGGGDGGATGGIRTGNIPTLSFFLLFSLPSANDSSDSTLRAAPLWNSSARTAQSALVFPPPLDILLCLLLWPNTEATCEGR